MHLASPVTTLMPEVVFSDIKILSKLLALKETSTCDPDDIHPTVLIYDEITLICPLRKIFNKSGVLLSQWLTAYVTRFTNIAVLVLELEIITQLASYLSAVKFLNAI